MAKRVSLYIEDTEIKLLVTSGNQVDKWASFKLDSGLVSGGAILDENLVAEAVKELFKLQGVKDTTVTVGVSGLNSVFRVISIPEVPKNLVQEAVGNEASRILPMPLSQVYYSYQLLPSPKGEMRLFLVAYPREATETLLSVIHKAGLKAETMDLAPLALARCVNEERAIIVNSWLTFVDIIVLSDRIPVVIRSLSLPVDSTSFHERMPAITEELNRTITFYNSTFPDKPLTTNNTIYVSGDIASDEESVQYLGKLGYPVSIPVLPLTFPDVFAPTQFMVSAGLALKGKLPTGAGNAYSIIDFNALPEAYKPPGFNIGRVLVPVGGVVVIGAIAFGAAALISLRNDTKTLTNQYNSIQTQTVKLQVGNKSTQDSITAKTAESTALAAQAGTLQGKIDVIQNNKTLFTGQFNGLASALTKCNRDVQEVINDAPKGLNLTDVGYAADGVSIKGSASSQALVLTYARSLRTGGRFKTVDVTSIEFQPDGTVGFSLVLS